MTTKPKIIVLDDPTGSQTVHSRLLLTRWDVETLRLGLADRRRFSADKYAIVPDKAASVTREVCRNLKQAL